MGAVWLTARGEVRQRWRSLLALGLLGAVLGAVVVGAVAGARRTSTAYDRLVEATALWDVEIALADDESIEAIRALPSVRRRRRDLAVVRAIGFLRRDVVASVAIQSSTLVAVGLLVGVPLGVAVGRSAWSLVARGLGVAPSPTIPAVALGLVVLGALAGAAAIALWPAHRAATTAPADALRAE